MLRRFFNVVTVAGGPYRVKPGSACRRKLLVSHGTMLASGRYLDHRHVPHAQP